MAQAHNKFMVFVGDDSDALLALAEASVLNAKNVAPKSLGVEYVEGDDLYVLTLGYRDDDSYPVKFTEVDLGKFDLRNPETPAQIAAAMEKAAEGIERVLCHEFFVDGAGCVVCVFMARGAKN